MTALFSLRSHIYCHFLSDAKMVKKSIFSLIKDPLTVLEIGVSQNYFLFVGLIKYSSE